MPNHDRRGRWERASPVWEDAFLAALGRSGCVTAAAGVAGITARGAQKRRAKVMSFAVAWRAALAAARALRAAELLRAEIAGGAAPRGDHRGVCLSRPGARLTAADDDAFLDMLAASANVRLSAKAAGASAQAFYKRRLRDDRFKAAWDAAIEIGRERLSIMLVEAACHSFDPTSHLRLGMLDGDPQLERLQQDRDQLPPVSVDAAIRILGMARGKPPRGRGREAWRVPAKTLDEVKDSILWKIAAIERAHQKQRDEEAGARAGD